MNTSISYTRLPLKVCVCDCLTLKVRAWAIITGLQEGRDEAAYTAGVDSGSTG